MQMFAATVVAVVPPNALQVVYSYQGTNLPTLVRPVLCGAATGLHWMPQQGDAVWIVHMENGYPVALCGLAAPTSAQLANLPILQAGESALYGPTGNVLKLVQAGGVEAGNPNSTFKAVALDGDAIVGTISCPVDGGDATFHLTIQATSTTLKGN